MEKQLEASVHKAIAFMEEHGFRYALIGGIALAQWGVVRATYDVDFKVLVPNNWLMEFAEALDNKDLLTRYKRLLAQAKDVH